MLRPYSCWLLALVSTLAVATNLKGRLADAGITAVFPGDPNYVTISTPFNLRYVYQPAVVAFPNTPKDVSEILKLSYGLNWTAVARSGGHSYIANGLGGKDGVVVLDMQNLNRVTVDPTKNTAVIESGNRLGDIALALSKYGRGLPHGTCPYVGIGGHASYGGFGFTSRMWGLTLDTITAVNMVLANGTIATASNDRHSDLFWAVRGSASSFGIVTSIEVKTFPEPPSGIIFQYEWILDVDGMAKALDVVQNYLESGIPPEVGGEINLFRGPTQGTIVFHISGGWYGPADQLNATVAPLLEKMPDGPKTTITPGNYSESVVFLAGGSLDTHTAPDVHDTFYAKSLMTPEASPMSLEARTAFAHFLANDAFTTDIQWFIQMEIYGGSNSAINAVGPDATAFAHRGSLFTIQFYSAAVGSVPPYPERGFAFVDSLVNSITANSPPHWDYGAYPNYVDDRLVDWQARYYGAHYPRLQVLKDKYDPRGVFSFPTGIENRKR
ncbi:glucooligosaccharide oxidase [Collybia nuda]|uniref:Glucooligosaccharide oxidase n=1 Tax=Collybia nuda TaxID=64659 RepID=A0A9P5XV51_9AGAR|nr:glucooligosaccharide oxidase [Collybia nuda]